MVKSKNALVAHNASLAGRAMERLTVAAAEALKNADKANGGAQSFQAISSGSDVTALFKAPGITMQFRNGEFALDVAGTAKTT